MRSPFSHCVGGVLSADIAVPEHERELAFYSAVLTSGAAPLWRDDLTNNQGAPVIGLGVRTPEYDALPLQWMPHFQVADVAGSAARAVGMGAAELMHSKDDNGGSEWAVLVDPVGAAFGIIPVVPRTSESASGEAGIGCISWLSLTVPNAEASREFYQQVIGWSAASLAVEGGGDHSACFEMRMDDEVAAAGILQRRGETSDLPSAWLIHLTVGDLAESLRRVNEHGGVVIGGGAESNIAVVRDPVGVSVALQAV